MAQGEIVRLLLKKGEMTSRDISNEIKISQQNIIKNLKQMNKYGEIIIKKRKVPYSKGLVSFYKIK